MLRSLANFVLGETRFRQVTRLGLAGAAVVATGFGFSQLPTKNDAQAGTAEQGVEQQDAGPNTLRPIPGSDPTDTSEQQPVQSFVNAGHVQPAGYEDDGTVPPPVNDYAQPTLEDNSGPPASMSIGDEGPPTNDYGQGYGAASDPPAPISAAVISDNGPPPENAYATNDPTQAPVSPVSGYDTTPPPPTNNYGQPAPVGSPTSDVDNVQPLPSSSPANILSTPSSTQPPPAATSATPMQPLGTTTTNNLSPPATANDYAGQAPPTTTPSAGLAPLPTNNGNYGAVAPVGAPAMSNTYSAPSTPGGVAPIPGDRSLEGVQTPSVTVEKSAPAEVSVGQKATFEIVVRNVGQVVAHNVRVQDTVPEKTQYAGANPEANSNVGGILAWEFASLNPGEERVITLQLVPLAEGEIGSVAQVSFQTKASVRTISTKPDLKVQYSGPEQVLIGDQVKLGITISNQGSGAATNVALEADVPEGLQHVSGKQLAKAVGELQPGETRSFELVLDAVQAGLVTSPLAIRLDGQEPVTAQHQLQVIAPQLQVGCQGPSRRYLERDATFTIQIANPGTASATNVELVARLPKGLEFAEANKQGEYDAAEHAVYWLLDELPANQAGSVQLRVVPIETGQQPIRATAEADLEVTGSVDHMVQVESLAELQFSVSDVADPIETGSETTYVVTVENRGDKPDTNVSVQVSLPPGLKYIDSAGPTQAGGQQTAQGTQIVFGPLANLAANGTAEYQIRVQGVTEGDQKVRVTLQSAEVQRTPVTKEESTRVYRDDL